MTIEKIIETIKILTGGRKINRAAVERFNGEFEVRAFVMNPGDQGKKDTLLASFKDLAIAMQVRNELNLQNGF